MQLNPIPTELTTAATDALLGAAAVACAVLTWRRRQDAWRRRLWLGIFVGAAAGAWLGALLHGLVLPPSLKHSLWLPLYGLLALTVGMFVAAAIYEWRGARAAARAVAGAVAAACVFAPIAHTSDLGFQLFSLCEIVAMSFVLAVYLALAVARRSRALAMIAAGVVLTIAAAAVQTMTGILVTVIWPLNNNGVFHLIQLVATLFLFLGSYDNDQGAAVANR